MISFILTGIKEIAEFAWYRGCYMDGYVTDA